MEISVVFRDIFGRVFCQDQISVLPDFIMLFKNFPGFLNCNAISQPNLMLLISLALSVCESLLSDPQVYDILFQFNSSVHCVLKCIHPEVVDLVPFLVRGIASSVLEFLTKTPPSWLQQMSLEMFGLPVTLLRYHKSPPVLTLE